MPPRRRYSSSAYRRRLRPRVGRKSYRSRGLRTAVKMRSYLGKGAYRLGKGVSSQQVPSMHSNGSRFNVKHRECLATILQDPVDPAHPAITLLPALDQQLCPTNAAAFPWLSSIAKLFEQYQWKGVMVEYVPVVDSGSTSVSMGTVAMFCEYNPASTTNPTTAQVCLNQMWAQGARSSDRITMPIEVAPNGTPIPVNWTTQVANADQRLSSLGRLFVGCEGCPLPTAALPNPIVLGRIWITYDIDLLKPQLVRVDDEA